MIATTDKENQQKHTAHRPTDRPYEHAHLRLIMIDALLKNICWKIHWTRIATAGINALALPSFHEIGRSADTPAITGRRIGGASFFSAVDEGVRALVIADVAQFVGHVGALFAFLRAGVPD